MKIRFGLMGKKVATANEFLLIALASLLRLLLTYDFFILYFSNVLSICQSIIFLDYSSNDLQKKKKKIRDLLNCC